LDVPLSCFRRMRMTRITSKEDAIIRSRELARQPLPNNIRTPPPCLRDLKLEILQYRSSTCVQLLLRDLLWNRPSRHLQVKPDHTSSLAWDDDQNATIGLDGAFAADVGEVSAWEDVHHAPDDVGGVAVHGDAERAADAAVCAVACLGW